MLLYSTDILPIIEAEERTKQKIVLPAINSVISKESKKHGKKSLEYQLINELKKENFNDVAIYVGMALAQTKLAPHWSLDDIIGELKSKAHIDKKYHKQIDSKSDNLGEAEKKQLAIQIWKNIIENEGSRKIKLASDEGTEVEVKTDEIVDSIKDKNSALAHELQAGGNMSKIETAILNALSFFKKLSGIDKDYDYSDKQFYNYNPEKESASTTQYINTLIGRGKEYKEMPKSIPQEIGYILKNYELEENVIKFLNDINSILSSVDKNIMWPETDFAINNYEDLKKYFKSLSASSEKQRAEKILSSYKKKSKEIAKAAAGGIDEKEYKKLIENAVNEISDMSAYDEPKKFMIATRVAALNLITKNRAIIDYVIKEEKLTGLEDATENEKKEAVIDELASLIARGKKARELHLGRKPEAWKK